MIPHFRRVTDACHEFGSVMIHPIYHVGQHGDAATIVDLLDGSERREDDDALILATPNVAETTLLDALAGSNLALHSVGDCVAPRWAVHAIYEGRKLGISL